MRREADMKVADDVAVDRIARLAKKCRVVLLDMICRAGSGHAG